MSPPRLDKQGRCSDEAPKVEYLMPSNRYFARLSWAAFALLLLLVASPARAATISVFTNNSIIALGSVATLEVRLQLDVSEVASIFEGKFDLVGLGSIGSVAIDPLGFGTTWESAFGGIPGSQLLLSLTSSNRNDHVLLATIEITGLAPGIFELRLAPGTFLQRDTNTSPFFEDVPLGPAPGTTLASIQVVAGIPEPATVFLMSLGLASLGLLRRRSRRALP